MLITSAPIICGDITAPERIPNPPKNESEIQDTATDLAEGHDVNEYGSETHIKHESFAKRDDNDDYTIDFSVRERTIVGCCEVSIDGRAFDTVCVILADDMNDRVLIEQYIDWNGRTVLQREFMADSMMMKDGMNIGFRSEHYPHAIMINGSKYVCTAVAVTDFIFR